MSIRLSRIAAPVCFFAATLTVFGAPPNDNTDAWTITAPLGATTIYYTSNIETRGDMDMGASVQIQIINPVPAQAASKLIDNTNAPNAMSWYHDFPAPQNGWTPVGTTWKVQIKKTDDTIMEHKTITITDQWGA